MQPLEYHSVGYWFKAINRTITGARKNNFLIRGAQVVSRAGGMRSIRGPEVSLGSVRVGTRRAQSPTPHAPPLPASDTSTKMHLKLDASGRSSPTIVFRTLWEAQAPAYAV